MPYCRDVLFARQKDGCLDPFPVWDDIRTFNGHPWRGSVDIVTGGFPCQDISAAGKGAGIQGAKSSLWFEMARVVLEVRPRFVLVENSPNLTTRGIYRVLGDLASMGYDARWGVLGACHVGAPHYRLRIWILANSNSAWKSCPPKSIESKRGLGVGELYQRAQVADSESIGREAGQLVLPKKVPNTWPTEPDVCRVAHGISNRVDRLTALGNGQVPRVVALAWEILKDG